MQDRDPVRVISLLRTPDRRRVFEQENKNLYFEYFDAIDGSTLTLEEILQTGLFETDLPYTPGAYGAALSHLHLWEEAIRYDKNVTIAEDDAIFRSDFDEYQDRVLKELPEKWDFILWGWNFDSVLSLKAMPETSPSVMLFSQDKLRNSCDAFKASRHKVNLFRLDKALGIPAYTISPYGAKKFKEKCFPQRHISVYLPVLNHLIQNNGVDISMNNIYCSTQSYVCFPPLVITKNDRKISTIQID